MEEAVSGVKGQLAIKIYGDDLKTLEQKGEEIVGRDATGPGIADLGLFRVIGQPNLEFVVDREQAARYGINVADVQDAIETAVGGKAVSQVLQGEQRYDLVVRYRRTTAIPGKPSRISACWRPRASACRWRSSAASTGARRRFGNLPRRQLPLRGHQVQRARPRPGQHRRRGHAQGGQQVKLPAGYHIEWAGEYESQKRSRSAS